MPKLHKRVITIFNNHPEIAFWHITNFCDENIIKEFLIDCPIKVINIKIILKHKFRTCNICELEF